MTTWTPITIEQIYDKILETEKELNGELSNFWEKSILRSGPKRLTDRKETDSGLSDSSDNE